MPVITRFLRHYHQDVFQPERPRCSALLCAFMAGIMPFSISRPSTCSKATFPVCAQRLVRKWAQQYQQELLHMWQTNEFKTSTGTGVTE